MVPAILGRDIKVSERNKAMQKRHLSIIILVVTLLLSTWGNVIAAGFCPRFALNRDCCFKHVNYQPKQVAHQPSCHKEMGDSDMGDMQMEAAPASEPDADAEASPMELTSEVTVDKVAVDLPIETCPHCLSHSQPASGAVSSALAVDPAKRLVDTDSPPADFAVASPSASPISITPSEHGPPGISLPRHVLINVFRI